MTYCVLADAIVVVHFLFVLFVVGGGLLVFRWPRVAWLHLPAAIWGVLIEFMSWTCPLTPLENYLRRLSGESGYSGGFVEQYVLSILYPEGLTRNTQLTLGLLVLGLNLAVYGTLVFRRWQKTRRDFRGSSVL